MRIEDVTAHWPTQDPQRIPSRDDRKEVVTTRDRRPADGKERREDLPEHQEGSRSDGESGGIE